VITWLGMRSATSPLGPYVIDEQVRGRDRTRRLDIFEVRQGKIVREWESGPLPKAP
jgi:hypothetical protein